MSGEARAAVLTVEAEIDGERSRRRFDCLYILRDGGFEVRYTEENGDENKLRFTEYGLGGGARAEIERSGQSSGLMVVEPFRTSPCCMHTPQGRLDLRVYGKEVMLKFCDTVAWTEFSYTVTLGGGSSDVAYKMCARVIE